MLEVLYRVLARLKVASVPRRRAVKAPWGIIILPQAISISRLETFAERRHPEFLTNNQLENGQTEGRSVGKGRCGSVGLVDTARVAKTDNNDRANLQYKIRRDPA